MMVMVMVMIGVGVRSGVLILESASSSSSSASSRSSFRLTDWERRVVRPIDIAVVEDLFVPTLKLKLRIGIEIGIVGMRMKGKIR
jgi:hypothetical protein